MRAHETRFTAVAVLLAGLALPAWADDPTCQQILDLVQQDLPPGVGDPNLMGRLLNPQVGPQFVDLFPQMAFNSALPAVQSQLQPSPGDCRKDNAGRPIGCRVESTQLGEFLHFDSSNGKVAYLNRNREYRGGNNTIPQQDALAMVDSVMEAFGVPPAELGPPDVKDLMIASGSQQSGKPVDFILRSEVHVRRERRVEGAPVFDSGLFGVVDANGLIARMRIQWPRFALIQGLASALMLDRDQVAEMAAHELSQGGLCDSYSSVQSIIAYVPARETLSSDRNDDGGGPTAPSGEGFVPALVVYASPVEVPEDSGEVAMAGQQIIVPLLDAKGDENARAEGD